MAHGARLCRVRTQSSHSEKMKAPNLPRAQGLFLTSRRLALAAFVLCAGIASAPMLHAQAPAAPPGPSSPDALEFDVADRLFRSNKFKEAAEAFTKFLAKYKMLSPRSLDAKFRLAVSNLQEGLYEEGTKQLQELIGNPRIDQAAREMAQLLVAKGITMKASKLPSDTPEGKEAQKKAMAEGIKAYDDFIMAFPKSRDMDSVQFLRAILLLQTDMYDEAIKGFAVVARTPTSPYAWEALMWIGKTFFIQGSALMEVKGGKEVSPDNVKRALALFENAEPSLTQAYLKSGDLALMNEAIFFVGQLQLTRSQRVTGGDDEKNKKRQAELLKASLEAFRAVRSVEEIVESQTAKIAMLEQQIKMLPVGTVDYLPMKTRIESQIAYEDGKREKYKGGADQFLAARLAIARIFLFLHKTDEARTLMRVLLTRPELFEKDKDGQATLASLMCLTYAEQFAELNAKVKARDTEPAVRTAAEAALPKLAARALETYRDFRKDFKGNAAGDNLALLVANSLAEQGDADQAEKIVAEGQEDYKDWRFTSEAMQILTATALKKGDFTKALDLSDNLLATNPKAEIEAQTLMVKGSIQQAQGREKGDAAMYDGAIATFKRLRDRHPVSPQAEDAWFATCQILGGREPQKAITELAGFIARFTEKEGVSPSTKTNLPQAQYLLGTAYLAANQRDKAIEAWKKVYEAYPESEQAPGAYFKVFDVLHETKDYEGALKIMEEFVTKYPKHENVYFAYNNMAEFLFSGALNPKKGPDVETGSRKLLDYVEYELTNKLPQRRGDGSLLKISGVWLKEMPKPIYLSLNPAQKQTWQKCVDGVTSAVERILKDYPESEKIAEALDRLVTIQNAKRKAQKTDTAQVEEYFKKLSAEYGKTPLVTAKIDMALASFLYENDPKRTFKMMDDAFRAVPKSPTAKDPDGNERIAATFTPSDFDRYLTGLFNAKRNDEITNNVARIRQEYPLNDKDDTAKIPRAVLDAQAVAHFWEAKLLQEQGKATEAGAKFSELKTKFPKSSKALEADYGVILGEFEQTGQVKEDYVQRLSKIVNTQTGKSFELQAKALFLIGRIQEAKKDFDSAIETYAKIQDRYASAPKIASAGLWKAAELSEKQARGEAGYPVKTKKERRDAAEARAAEIKASKATEKPADTKPGDTKPDDEKPAEPKPAAAKSVSAGAPQK